MPSDTYKFLGPETGWLRCGVDLIDPHGLWPGVLIHVDGTGRCVIRRQHGSKEMRYTVKLQPLEVEAIFKAVLAADLVALKIPHVKPPVPDSRCPALVLRNAFGRAHTVSKWSHEESPAFDRVHQALLALLKKAEGLTPEYDGAYDPPWRP